MFKINSFSKHVVNHSSFKTEYFNDLIHAHESVFGFESIQHVVRAVACEVLNFHTYFHEYLAAVVGHRWLQICYMVWALTLSEKLDELSHITIVQNAVVFIRICVVGSLGGWIAGKVFTQKESLHLKQVVKAIWMASCTGFMPHTKTLACTWERWLMLNACGVGILQCPVSYLAWCSCIHLLVSVEWVMVGIGYKDIITHITDNFGQVQTPLLHSMSAC